MNTLLAVVTLTDLALPAIILIFIILGGAASRATRQRPNLHRIERKLDALLQHHGVQIPCNLSPEVQRLASDPTQKITAIKLHREQTGVSLADAKSDVESCSS